MTVNSEVVGSPDSGKTQKKPRTQIYMDVSHIDPKAPENVHLEGDEEEERMSTWVNSLTI